MPRWLLPIALVAVLCTHVRDADADAKADARVHVQAADTHFKLGRFSEALAEYTKAYELYPTPPLLFNIGQCHRNLQQWDQAVFFFEGFLRERPDAPNRGVVEDLIKEARAASEAARARQAEEEAAQKRLKLEAEQRRILEEQAARQAQQRTTDEQRLAQPRRAHDDRPFYSRWWFWAIVGGSVAAAGGTAYYFSGDTSVAPPTGSLGGLDRR